MEVTKEKFIFRIFLLLAASALLLTLISTPTNLPFLAWIAIVPFILACSPAVKTSRLVLTAWLVGFIYWTGNLYWLWYVTPAGHIGLCFYLGAYWAALAACVRFCRAKKIPLFIAAPILWVGAETLQGWFCDGVAWRFLAHSQYANLPLIQIADIFSTAGITFLIAMVNGLAADILLLVWQPPKVDVRVARPNRSVAVGLLITIAAISATLTYGYWRIGQSKEAISDGPMVGSVQPNVPLEVKESGDQSEQIFADCLSDSKAAGNAGAKLIAWPETMVQAVLNPEVVQLEEPNSQDVRFDQILRQHAKGKSYLLVGAYGRTIKWVGGRPQFDRKYNSAFMYRSDDTEDPKRYDKIHLVPFGEVVPFKQSIPWLHSLLMKFTPYDYDYTIDYGEQYTIFDMDDNRKVYHFGVLICYEDTVPTIARKLVIANNPKSETQNLKSIDWLVNISNDGWFVRFVNSKVLPSTELSQHVATCVFRAVENRLPILRSVNTGISCLIDSQGRIRDGFIAGNLPQKAMERQGMAGWFADRIPIDRRVTFFSIHGQWLDFTCMIILVLTLLIQVKIPRLTRNRKSPNPKSKI